MRRQLSPEANFWEIKSSGCRFYGFIRRRMRLLKCYHTHLSNAVTAQILYDINFFAFPVCTLLNNNLLALVVLPTAKINQPTACVGGTVNLLCTASGAATTLVVRRRSM